MFARVTPFLLFAAFLLLLLVTLSAPIIDAIYLFRLAIDTGTSFPGSGATGAVRFGVFGYCVSDVQASILGIGVDRDARCSSTRLGYTIDETVARVLRAEDIRDLVSRTTTAAFVLNPIATGLTFFAFVVSLFMLRRDTAFSQSRFGSTTVKTTRTSRIASFVTFALGLLAALAATTAFLINVVIVAVVRNRLSDATDSVTLNWGNAVWMTLGAAVALWIAVIGAIWGVCCGGRRRKHVNGTY
ncbi:hypothetical protein CC1G_11924 [Coprinopsis cinerea okayama7|uniref:Pali-domain-containing protein n=1 Tax=Coprinopsis cinerea (strain Okayama-7 / 130 / ATCC MYA-4618 / FGSC 9003) TaxID=240176 RepID=A8NFR0_COPC7|nr:hypothetical protein CC1G_11924 [Coprinopsis cinerea okayama7\|eukprot:XP_001833347.1 hypothetical protein CC1G_11924 [Coprinopsis cinerea okayama7\